METEKKLSATKRRILLVQFFYRHLLMKSPLQEIKQDLLDETQGAIDSETLKMAAEIANNLSNLIREVKPLLVENWKWERIPVVIQAILVVGAFEITMTETPKAITIDELTQLAKEWGLENEYKFINAILDKINKI